MSPFHWETAVSTMQVPGSEGRKREGKTRRSDLRPRTPTEDPWEPLKPSKGPGILFYDRIRSLQENGSKWVYSGPHPRLHQAALPHPKLLATHLVTQKTVFRAI